MILGTLIEGIQLKALAGADRAGSIRICDLTEDSRTAMPGSLFIARCGTADNGALYIDQAVHSGASAVITDDQNARIPEGFDAALFFTPEASHAGAEIAERFYGHPSGSLQVVGVTGTNGKTTIAHLTHQILRQASRGSSRVRCGLIGTVEIDDGRERSRAAMTTPPAIELSRTLATMVEHGCSACAMEVSSHALDQGRTSALSINGAGFTNLTGDHLDYHQTFESYTNAKKRFFADLQAGSVAVINIDDPAGQHMIDACREGVIVERCSMRDPKSDWYGEITGRSLDGMSMSISSPLGEFETSVPFFGDYNAGNVLIAMGLANVAMDNLEIASVARLEVLAHALPRLRLPCGRLDRASTPDDDLRVFVDFAHSDDSIKSCLEGVRAVLPEGARLWCVFGCGGDRDRTKRPRMGQAACAGADRIVLTSDNPRSESPSRIVDDVLAGLDDEQRSRVEVQVDRSKAIGFAIEHANPGDVVVIAGKGHEHEQVVADRSGRLIAHHFDDAEHARACLDQRRARIGVDA